MYLIVGLGNPGKEYDNTRHNMGFQQIDLFANTHHVTFDREKFGGKYCEILINNEKVILLKPQTYMNLSGESIIQYANFYKVDPEEILIIYDDIDIETGTIKIRKKGGAGTHNGMKSVVNELNTVDFPRIRVGTGSKEKVNNLIDYVISKVSEEEYERLEEGIEKAVEAVIEILKIGIDNAMNKLN